MSTENQLTVPEALKLLKKYSGIRVKTPQSDAEKQTLQQALLLIVAQSESSNLGVCADRLEQGLTALSSYLKAFGYSFQFDKASPSDGDSPVYLKFNSQKASYYLDSYTGTYRGVLVSCQSEDDVIAGTYGHFPLDLFM